MKKSVRNLIMSWVGWGGLGWVGDGMGWCEAILDISQGFKEGRR